MPFIRVRDAHLRRLGELGRTPSEGDDGVLDADLYGSAALEALKVLFQKWSDATYSAKTAADFSNVELLQDIDRTIGQLTKYRQAAQTAFTK